VVSFSLATLKLSIAPCAPIMHAIAWENDLGAIDAWKHGMTGYPIVYAGMRHLAAEGWIHNRLRMLGAYSWSKTS